MTSEAEQLALRIGGFAATDSDTQKVGKPDIVDMADYGQSFRIFYRTHVTTVRNVMFRMGLGSELDDAVQDCFVKAWQGLPHFAGKSSEKTWITRIAVNTANDYLKSKNRSRIDQDADNVILLVPANQHAVEASDIVHKLLRSLKVELRVVLVLSLIEGFSMEEISDILTIPVGTVKSRLHAARKEADSALKKMGVTL